MPRLSPALLLSAALLGGLSGPLPGLWALAQTPSIPQTPSAPQIPSVFQTPSVPQASPGGPAPISPVSIPATPAAGTLVPVQPAPPPTVPSTPSVPQTALPSTPPLAPPAPAPLPPTPLPTAPLPAAPLPTAEPEPVPAPLPSSAPQAAPKPAATPEAPLTLVLEVPLKGLQGGQPLIASDRQTFEIPAQRAAQLRQRGVVTASLEADLRAFARRSGRSPQDARFEQLTTGWALVQRDGVTVDLDASRAALLRALTSKAGGPQTVALRFTTAAPKRTLDYFTSRGITAFLATGSTTYYGSSPARVTNIHVGAGQFQDRLFTGGEFSFNAVLGPINAAAGFVPGLVIAGERTASGLGGGICQVSTTVFRALYRAGLPIVERRNHSYQVHYYDPQGLDATIYQPTQDLRFTNDSGGALWFQTVWNDATSTLDVSVFGRPRAYTVEIGTPRTLSTIPALPDRLISDASLPAGTRKQVDWAAPGATLEVTRRFLQGGRLLRSDVLRSVYRPWPNIFMVGTGR